MQYYVNGINVSKVNFKSQLDIEVCNHVLKNNSLDEFLDEVYPNIIISGIEFKASDIFKNCDLIAYKERCNNFIDDEVKFMMEYFDCNECIEYYNDIEFKTIKE